MALSLSADLHGDIQIIYTERWFGQCVPKDQKMEIYIFRFTNESKRILLFNYDMIAFFITALYGTSQKIFVFLRRANLFLEA